MSVGAAVAVPPTDRPSAALTGALMASLLASHLLNAEEMDAVRNLRGRVRTHAPRSPLHARADGEPSDLADVVVSGWAAHERRLPDGRRQLLDLLVPGDLLCPASEHRPLARAQVVALTEVRLMDVSTLLAAVPPRSSLAVAVAIAGRAEEVRLFDQIVRLGRLSALERTAHWIVEMEARLRTVGLAMGGGFRLPLAQAVIGEFLGLSVVQVNRTFRELRALGLVDSGSGWLEVRDLPGLILLSGAAAAGPPTPVGAAN